MVGKHQTHSTVEEQRQRTLVLITTAYLNRESVSIRSLLRDLGVSSNQSVHRYVAHLAAEGLIAIFDRSRMMPTIKGLGEAAKDPSVRALLDRTSSSYRDLVIERNER